jgi:hypothetical protein
MRDADYCTSPRQAWAWCAGIEGNVPASLLQMSDVVGVKQYCKWLIDVVGKDGGFIMCPGSVVDKVKPENLKAMVDFSREYGKYR